MYSFEKLETWKEAWQLRMDARKRVSGFPAEKNSGVDQLPRTFRFVTAIITQDNGCFHYRENIKFCGYIVYLKNLKRPILKVFSQYLNTRYPNTHPWR